MLGSAVVGGVLLALIEGVGIMGCDSVLFEQPDYYLCVLLAEIKVPTKNDFKTTFTPNTGEQNVFGTIPPYRPSTGPCHSENEMISTPPRRLQHRRRSLLQGGIFYDASSETATAM